jgi:hypothetical protein
MSYDTDEHLAEEKDCATSRKTIGCLSQSRSLTGGCIPPQSTIRPEALQNLISLLISREVQSVVRIL